MISIIKAKKGDFHLLADLGKTTLIESHWSSAAAEDISIYVDKNYSYQAVEAELDVAKNLYHIIYFEKKAVGYSKIVLNAWHSNVRLKNVAKLDRLYLLKEFYGLKLGFALFDFNVALSKRYNQAGMWLFVWQGNRRAIDFYQKMGFQITGNYDFKLSENHSNSSHQMLLIY